MKITFHDVSYALALAGLSHDVQNVDRFTKCWRVLFVRDLTPEELPRMQLWANMRVVFSLDYKREVNFTDGLPVSVDSATDQCSVYGAD